MDKPTVGERLASKMEAAEVKILRDAIRLELGQLQGLDPDHVESYDQMLKLLGD